MNILITGAAGGIGSTLALLLTQKGHKVIAYDNLNNGYLDNLKENGVFFCRFESGDIRDTDFLQEVIIRENIEKVIHLAAITALPVAESDPYECLSVNVAGTASVLKAAKFVNAQVIVASTSAIYENNEPADAPFKEQIEVKPRLMYPLSKKLMEEVVHAFDKNYGIDYTILRFFNVFGPRQDIHRKSPPLINYIVREVKNGREPVFYSDGKQQRDYVHVDDVVTMIEKCLSHPNALGQTFNLCTTTLTSVRDIIGFAEQAFSMEIKHSFLPAKEFWSEYNELHSGEKPIKKTVLEHEVNKFALGSNELAKQVIGWEPNKNISELMVDTMRKNYELYSK